MSGGKCSSRETRIPGKVRKLIMSGGKCSSRETRIPGKLGKFGMSGENVAQGKLEYLETREIGNVRGNVAQGKLENLENHGNFIRSRKT